MSRTNKAYAVLVVVFLLILNVANGVYAAARVAPSPAVTILGYFGLATILYFWFAQYSRAYGLAWNMDMGWFLYLAWWAVIPYQLFKLRGRKAWLTILCFAGIYLGTYVVGILVYYALI
jgi:hypothetical protein